LKSKRNLGLPPGSMKYTGSLTSTPVVVNYLEYNEEYCKQELGESGSDIILHPSIPKIVQWYDIRGLHDEELIDSISKRFDVHPLAMEGALDVYQRPNFVEYNNGHFFAFKSIKFDKNTQTVIKQSLSIFFGEDFVISFQENVDDTFEGVRHRINQAKGKIRKRTADYLAYAIIDYVVDNYFNALDAIEEEIQLLEESISTASDATDKSKIYKLKKEILIIRKAVAPLREAINLFSRSESEFINENTVTYLRDVYDHTIQILDNVDSMRDILSGLQDLYLSEISMRMNRVMQVLTIVTAIFVPLSFLAGLYGMNFEYIPELKFKNGYFYLISVMFVIALSMIIFFKKRKWF